MFLKHPMLDFFGTQDLSYPSHFANCKGEYQKQVQAPIFKSGLTDEYTQSIL